MAAGSISRSHILTQGEFIKEPIRASNEEGNKIRLYRLPDLEQKTLETAKQAIKNAQNIKERDYEGKIGKFLEDAQIHPYLLRKGNSLKLTSKEEANEVLDQYGISEEKAKELSTGALGLLKQHSIQTGEDLIQFYNTSDEKVRKTLFPVFNVMLVIFQKNRPIQREEEIKTLTLFATCDDDAIRTAGLDAMMQLFEADGFQNIDYGYGLKYLIDNLPPEFLNTTQLRLLTIFEKLTMHLDTLLHTGRTVNHEIEPLMAALVSISRAIRQSEIPGLAKGTKDNFYARLKKFYYNEEYTKRITSLSKDKNYLLEFEAIWPLQHLVRVPSSEHKAVTFIRKTGHGLYAAKKLAGAPSKAFMGLLNGGVLPDENIIPDLQEAYKHAEKAFGFKDIPRPWFDMLEHTEEALMKPELTSKTLEIVYEVATEYDQMQHAFNKVVTHNFEKITGKDKNEISLKENKEFAFGFVGQLSDLAMDHPDEAVRHKAIEILERIFLQNKQSKDVRVFILTTLQNIIQRKGNDTQKAQSLKNQLETHKPDLQGAQLFRASKYPCLALKPDNDLLLDAAKQKLQRINGGQEELPLSKFVYGYQETKIFEKKVKIGGNYNPKPPEPIKPEELQGAVEAAEKLHKSMIDKNSGKLDVINEFGNRKETIHKGDVEITGDFNG